MKLLLHEHGTAELIDARGNRLWASDSDDAFADEFQDEFVEDDDAEEVLEFLADHGYLQHDELDDVEIVVRSLEGDDEEDLEDDEEGLEDDEDCDLFPYA